MTDNEIIKANDILDKFDFFNRRAGRELWNEKTVAVQDEDIRDREKDIKFLKDLIDRQRAEIENLEKQMGWLTGYNKNLMDANTALSEEILEAKAEAYKEFAERLKKPISKCRLTAITEKETCSPGSELWEFWNAQEVEAELMLKSIDRIEKELTEEEE